MPAYSFLHTTPLSDADIEDKMRALRKVGVPYADADIAAAKAELKGKTEEDALVAYLQGLGTALKNVH
jgi:cytochrome c oxidase cbb3-type subunit 2